MSINIWTDSMQHAALLGKPVLFTNWLIQRDIIPDGWYCYDLRGTHKSPSTRTTLVDHAADYHAGTVLSPIPLKHEGTASRRVNGTFYLLGEEMTLEQFCEEHDLAYPQDNREFVLRPASLDEVGLFYSEEKLDEALGTVGHLRMDFGHGEKEFWHTWWPHNEDIITTAYLRNEDIQTAVEENIDYLNPPVRSVFVEFLTRIKLVDPDVDAALQDMGTKIDNAVFREWVAALLTCRHDRGLKTILTPIVAKLSDMRIVNGELENLVFEPRKEFITMQVLVIGNIPLLYWLNQDWYDVLMHTPLGQALLAAIAAVMFISTAAVIKLTQPIEYRR